MLNCNLHQLMHFRKKFFFFLFLIFKFIFADVLIQILTDIPRIYILPDFKGVERFTNWKQDFESEKGKKKKTCCFPESSISRLGGKNASTKKNLKRFRLSRNCLVVFRRTSKWQQTFFRLISGDYLSVSQCPRFLIF